VGHLLAKRFWKPGFVGGQRSERELDVTAPVQRLEQIGDFVGLSRVISSYRSVPIAILGIETPGENAGSQHAVAIGMRNHQPRVT
jgi:hypothetical protein